MVFSANQRTSENLSGIVALQSEVWDFVSWRSGDEGALDTPRILAWRLLQDEMQLPGPGFDSMQEIFRCTLVSSFDARQGHRLGLDDTRLQ